jgi:hypothetical protein
MATMTNSPAHLEDEPESAEAWSTRKGQVTASRWRWALRKTLRSVPRLIVTCLAAALLVLPIADGTQNAEAGKKSKNTMVTKTFSSNGQIDIPDTGMQGPANPYPSLIEVDAFDKYKKAKIVDVNLILRGFSHPYPNQVDVMLAQGNQRAIVMADAGGTIDAEDLNITLDDQAAQELPNGDELFSGTYQPANLPGTDPFPAPAPAPNGNSALSIFENGNPDGEWRLFVSDDFNIENSDTGAFAQGWKLEITAKVTKNKKK